MVIPSLADARAMPQGCQAKGTIGDGKTTLGRLNETGDDAEAMKDAPGRLFVVATPLGNLEDLSPRAVRVLRECHLVAAEDTRHSRTLLRAHGVGTPMTSFFEHN